MQLIRKIKLANEEIYFDEDGYIEDQCLFALAGGNPELEPDECNCESCKEFKKIQDDE